MEKIKISWEQYIEDCYILKEKISYDPEALILVPRGGLFVGGIIAQRFPGIRCECDKEPGKSRWWGKCLIIDDCVDTGNTMKGVGNGAKIAVLYWKPKSVVEPDFYVRKVPDEWIQFPYENE